MMLKGKVGIVTGAARGLGAGIARAYCEAGASVVLSDMIEEGEETAARLRSEGYEAVFEQHDVCDVDGWAKLVANTRERFGGIDSLVNNAGISRTRTIEDATLKDFHDSLEVNLLGAFKGMQAVIPAMKERGGGSIINIASNSTQKLVAITTIYSATKAALANMGKSAAIHLAQTGTNIRVNSIHPGPARTPMLGGSNAEDPHIQALIKAIPLGRMAEPADVGAVAVFLASDGASYITGSEYFIDGGLTFT